MEYYLATVDSSTLRSGEIYDKVQAEMLGKGRRRLVGVIHSLVNVCLHQEPTKRWRGLR